MNRDLTTPGKCYICHQTEKEFIKIHDITIPINKTPSDFKYQTKILSPHIFNTEYKIHITLCPVCYELHLHAHPHPESDKKFVETRKLNK